MQADRTSNLRNKEEEEEEEEEEGKVSMEQYL